MTRYFKADDAGTIRTRSSANRVYSHYVPATCGFASSYKNAMAATPAGARMPVECQEITAKEYRAILTQQKAAAARKHFADRRMEIEAGK